MFFFSSRRRHTRCTGDWSAYVCSSDLDGRLGTGEKLRPLDDQCSRRRGMADHRDLVGDHVPAAEERRERKGRVRFLPLCVHGWQACRERARLRATARLTREADRGLLEGEVQAVTIKSQPPQSPFLWKGEGKLTPFRRKGVAPQARGDVPVHAKAIPLDPPSFRRGR